MHTDLDVCYDLLPLVSRTFALNIRILPGELRPAVTVAYLLFRFVDTIEDTPGLTTEERSCLFDVALERLAGDATRRFPEPLERSMRRGASEGERRLVDESARVFRAFDDLAEPTHVIVAEHVAETTRGMNRVSATRTVDGVLQLRTWADLDEYCYLVAGTIGVMLTRLFVQHSDHIDATSAKHLTALAEGFGRGLQLTNILKGVGVDREGGRVYLPADALAQYGATPDRLLDPAAQDAVAAVVREIVPRALRDLEDALRYTLLLPRREPRLRIFCLWPLFTAVRTLGVIAQTAGVVDRSAQPKISRGALYREMAISTATVFSNQSLKRRFARFRRDLFPPTAHERVWAG
jgi:farnesyl-diphosphate farnesyltransferase